MQNREMRAQGDKPPSEDDLVRALMDITWLQGAILPHALD